HFLRLIYFCSLLRSEWHIFLLDLLWLVDPVGIDIVPLDGVLLHLLGEALAALLEGWERVDPASLFEPAPIPVVEAVRLLLVAHEVGSDVPGQEYPDLNLDCPAPGALEVGVLDVAPKQCLLRARVRL